MKTSLKILHIISLSIFLGSIATYIFLGSLISENQTVALELNRQWVASSTGYLTIPAMWLTGLTGLLMRRKSTARWLWAKLVGFIFIVLNTHVFIYPAILTSVTSVGENSIQFNEAMQQEAAFGAINLLLIITLIAIASIKPKFAGKL